MTVFEDFVFSKIMIESDVDNCYFYLPNNNCFTYCISEIRHALKNQISEKINNNSHVVELAKTFYDFLDHDKILKKVDSVYYSSILLLIKSISEGCPTEKNEAIIEKLSMYKRLLSNKYFETIIKEILKTSTEEKFDEDNLSYLVELFLNEALARDIDIRFIHTSADWFINEKRFKTLTDYFYYFLQYNNFSACDIYLPIKNFKKSNFDIFEKNEQEVIIRDDSTFLHVYNNQIIDFYSIIKKNMTRIQSIFNLLKLYTNSQIDFDYGKNVEIILNNKRFIGGQCKFEIPFSHFVFYKGVSPYSKFLNNTISNLSSISERDSVTYHKILNIIGYAEKDNDIINPSSYVDAWIATESLYSLSGLYSGYEAVKKIMPYSISTKFIVKRLTFLLQQSFKDERRLSLESFVEKACNGDKLRMTSSNPFYRYELSKMYDVCTNVKKLSSYYNYVEGNIRTALLRIYILRNEYVHESKLHAYSSLEFYKLKNYLTFSLDVFFGMLNQRIEFIDRKDNLMFDVFARIAFKNQEREMVFKMNNENIKYNNKSDVLKITELESEISLNDLIVNVLLNNNHINKKFVKYNNDNE